MIKIIHISSSSYSAPTVGEKKQSSSTYQIWLFDSFSSCHLLNPDYNTDTINHEGYWIDSFIEVVKEARQLLKAFDDHFIMTDGRRVFATKITYKSQFKEVNHSRTREEINEARKVLEKLAYHQNTLDVPRNFQWFTNNISRRSRNMRAPKNGIQPKDFLNQQ